MHVAELVPQVPLGLGRRRRTPPSRSRPAIASSIARCDASGSCHPVNSPSTERTERSGVTTVSVHPSLGCTARFVHHRLERADHGRADGDDPAARAAGVVDASAARETPRSTPRTVARSPRARPRRCAAARDDAHALGHQPGQDLGLNGRPALGISADPASVATRSGSRIGSCRARSRSGSVARGGEEPSGARASRSAPPTASRRPAGVGGVGGEQRDVPAAGEVVGVAGRAPGRPGRRAAARRSRALPGAGSRGAPGRPSRPVPWPSSSAASVPEVLITTRSPSSRKRGSSEKCECTRVPSDLVATSIRTARGSCRGSRGGRRLELGREREERGAARAGGRRLRGRGPERGAHATAPALASSAAR